MRTHNGMRPHDIAVLLKIISKGDMPWMNKSLAEELYISQSEITESLLRSTIAGLLDPSKKKVFKKSLTEFLFYGLKYVFPAVAGALTKGIPTAHAAPVMLPFFTTAEKYVWPDVEGNDRGMAIMPLYPNAVKAVQNDPELYALLALCDVLRIGKVREIKKAHELLQELINGKAHAASY